MQVGALRALLESGYHPDLITGTSIGAANGAFLVIHGFNPQGIDKLEQVWRLTVDQDFLPTNLWWQTMRAFLRRTSGFSQQRVREFAIACGLTPEIRFRDLKEIKLYPVAADLNTGCPVIFGLNPEESVLDSVLASMALPPWIPPQHEHGRYLVDGAAVSNLPIEAALAQGATEIIALDLLDSHDAPGVASKVGDFLMKLDYAVENRQAQLEIQLAEARGVPVRHISLIAEKPVQIWDFRQGVELMARGYELARAAVAAWPHEKPHSWWQRKEIQVVLEEILETLE
jgi:NTE family protein